RGATPGATASAASSGVESVAAEAADRTEQGVEPRPPAFSFGVPDSHCERTLGRSCLSPSGDGSLGWRRILMHIEESRPHQHCRFPVTRGHECCTVIRYNPDARRSPMGVMQVTYSYARNNLAEILDATEKSQEPVIIKRRGHEDMAVLPAAELQSL